MYACANQDVSSAVIEELMNVESISATIVDNDGNTALHHLMASNRRSIRTSAILALLQRGGSFVARNHAGQTALEVLYDIHAGSGTFSATLIQLMKTHSPDMAEENIQKAKEAATEALTVAILLHPEPHANCMTPDALQLFSDFHTAKTLQSIDIILVR
jgi:2-polyprenyl-3-methyl-5-hydroxy-6-metoxy-1,4-benzoquinol methylase